MRGRGRGGALRHDGRRDGRRVVDRTASWWSRPAATSSRSARPAAASSSSRPAAASSSSRPAATSSWSRPAAASSPMAPSSWSRAAPSSRAKRSWSSWGDRLAELHTGDAGEILVVAHVQKHRVRERPAGLRQPERHEHRRLAALHTHHRHRLGRVPRAAGRRRVRDRHDVLVARGLLEHVAVPGVVELGEELRSCGTLARARRPRRLHDAREHQHGAERHRDRSEARVATGARAGNVGHLDLRHSRATAGIGPDRGSARTGDRLRTGCVGEKALDPSAQDFGHHTPAGAPVDWWSYRLGGASMFTRIAQRCDQHACGATAGCAPRYATT